MSTLPRGDSANVYHEHSKLFADGVYQLNQLMLLHPLLRAVDAHVRPGRLDIVTIGGAGVVRDWVRALPPVVAQDSGIWSHVGNCGPTRILKTGHITVTVEMPS